MNLKLESESYSFSATCNTLMEKWTKFCVFQGRTGGVKGIYASKLPKLDLTANPKYVAHLVKLMLIFGCKRATVPFITFTWVCYTCIATLFSPISQVMID